MGEIEPPPAFLLLKSKARREAPLFPLLPPVQKIFFTGVNGDNEGLEQPILPPIIY